MIVHRLIAAAMCRLARERGIEIEASHSAPGFEAVYGDTWNGWLETVNIRLATAPIGTDRFMRADMLDVLLRDAKQSTCACGRRIGAHAIWLPADAKAGELPCLTEFDQLSVEPAPARLVRCNGTLCERRAFAARIVALAGNVIAFYCDACADSELRSVDMRLTV